MLLLLTILLVLVAAITLVIGIFSDQLALIWVSIAASFAAAVVLAVVSQTSKRRAQADAAVPAPVEPAEAARAAEPATTAVPDVPPGEPTAVIAAVPAGGGFPIDDYDSLKVTEIIPRLESLSLDELEMVAIYEEDNKNRTTVLSRIDDLMDALEGVAPAAEAPIEAGPALAAAPASPGELPIAGYDDLNVSDILPKLDDLDADELEQVAVYEESNKDRVTILNAIDDRLDVLEGVVAEPAPAPAKKAAAKKAPAKKAAKKSAAKKAPAKKAAKKSAKKTTAKKSAKKSTAKKTAKKTTKKR